MDQECKGMSFLLPRILLFSLTRLYFLSGCPAYTSSLATDESVFVENMIDRIQTILPYQRKISFKIGAQKNMVDDR